MTQKTIIDSGKATINDDVDKAAFAQATKSVWSIYTRRFGNTSIKAIQAIP